jgi:GcrA cell cycle regulator
VKWTDKMDAVLRRCRLSGLSCSQTAAVIKAEIGVNLSRNSVIGRACRLGLPHVDGQATKVYAAKVNRKKSGMAAPRFASVKKLKVPSFVPSKAEPVPPPAEDDIPTKTLMELEPGDCRWRVDKPLRNEPYGFCAKEALPGLSVCAQHAPRQFANWAEVKHKYVKPVEAREKEAV